MPGQYLFWLAGLILRTLHQAILWAAGLVLLGIVLIYGLVLSWPEGKPKKAASGAAQEGLPSVKGRVAYWRTQIRLLRAQGIESDFANYEFRRLAQNVIDLQGGSSTGEEGESSSLEAANIPPANQTANMPPVIRVFFTRSRTRITGSPPRQPFSARWLARWRRSSSKPDPDSDPLNELCHYLESYLEVQHDESNRP